MKTQTISIHGKQYMPVSGRVELAHADLKALSITTEILPVEGMVVIKATVLTPKGTFTGISAANPSKMIEKLSPYEVAETSAIGRALGFAGYGIVDGIATADEMNKASVGIVEPKKAIADDDPEWIAKPAEKAQVSGKCSECQTTNQYHKKGCPAEVPAKIV